MVRLHAPIPNEMKNNVDSECKREEIQLACLLLFCMKMLEDDTFFIRMGGYVIPDGFWKKLEVPKVIW